MGSAKTKGKRLDGSGFKLPRKPEQKPAADEKRVAAFVEAVEVSQTRTPPQASRLRRVERGERVAVYLPAEIAEALRVRCARERRSASDAVTEAVRMWLEDPRSVATEGRV